ncbi:hypothetical protein [Oceanobacillus halophilus]|uniref:GRAM domain-containing protein n=1 Tax=Oceanobacillus halophilus TaxID=930130 RepID=A0A495A2A2_9BACI|nr:hypothetical protein [Oceanobacillus halophilus]RKQ33562.1 hypothetical protein D8M06_10165 [Oceanobacillus halophilus]
MQIIAEQPYVKVERQVNSIEQVDIEHQRTLYLYHEKVVTEHREFPIKDIMDVSYRLIGDKGGLLYLHTSKGVYSYIVKTSPEEFVLKCKEHIYNK